MPLSNIHECDMTQDFYSEVLQQTFIAIGQLVPNCIAPKQNKKIPQNLKCEENNFLSRVIVDVIVLAVSIVHFLLFFYLFSLSHTHTQISHMRRV